MPYNDSVMEIRDIEAANKLNREDKRDLRTVLRLAHSSKARSSYTNAEIKAGRKTLKFIELNIL